MNSQDTTLNKKKSHLLMLLMLAEADNNQDALEDEFILQVGKRLGFDKVAIDHIDKHPEDMAFVIPKTDIERNTILSDLLFLMKFDGKVDNTEINLLHELAFRMGFRPTMTQEMIEIMKAHIGKTVPKNALLVVIKKQLN